MNNNQLLNEFRIISGTSNPFDCAIQLKEFNKQYKKSDFYKATKLNIFKAYELYNKMITPNLISRINELLDSDNLSEYLNNLLYSLDISAVINRFFYSINYDQLRETLQTFIPSITTEELQGMGEQLQIIVEKFKK